MWVFDANIRHYTRDKLTKAQHLILAEMVGFKDFK